MVFDPQGCADLYLACWLTKYNTVIVLKKYIWWFILGFKYILWRGYFLNKIHF